MDTTLILEILYIWVLSYAVFHLNPLNDKSNPFSRLHYFHPENIAGRQKLVETLEEEMSLKPSDSSRVVEWPDVWPFIASIGVTALCAIILIIFDN